MKLIKTTDGELITVGQDGDFKGDLIKYFPDRYYYMHPEEVFECLVDLKRKRLTNEERINLEIIYVKGDYNDHVLELIEDLQFNGTCIYKYRDGHIEYLAIFGKMKCKCSKLLCDLTKPEIKHVTR